MAKAAKNHVSFRAPPALLEFLQRRREEGESLGECARRLLEFYLALLREGLEEIRALGLSDEEAARVLEALNGVMITPETAPLLWAEVAERLGDEHPVARKIRSLSPAGRFALADAAERFWRGEEEVIREIVGRTP
ncbi:hypothetical protein [Thermoflexus sp.]|uniref:hypothetical protein n=1 Tax=Thermoflexus sp. TaxID=1969742 RepID=UPI002ADDE486|nr:hypothetical protein [Thermoflexus sp.]